MFALVAVHTLHATILSRAVSRLFVVDLNDCITEIDHNGTRSGLDSPGLPNLTSEALLTWLRSCPQNTIINYLSRFVRLMG